MAQSPKATTHLGLAVALYVRCKASFMFFGPCNKQNIRVTRRGHKAQAEALKIIIRVA